MPKSKETQIQGIWPVGHFGDFKIMMICQTTPWTARYELRGVKMNIMRESKYFLMGVMSAKARKR